MISVFAFALAPLLCLPIYIISYIFDKNKKGIIYSLLIGLALGIIAYYFVPKSGYDLIRHQKVVYELTGMSFTRFMSSIKNFDLEFIPLLYSYIISFFGNVNLLQFFVVTIGYSIILYILYDYRKIVKIKTIPFFLISLFTMISFQHLYFISGLYFYIAIIVFGLTLYCDYIKNKNKKICMIFYILTLFMHNAMFLPFGVLIIHKILKNKFSIKSAVLIAILFLASYFILDYVNTTFNNSITNNIMKMYNNYIENENHFKIYYSGSLYYLEIFKLAFVVLAIFLNKKANSSLTGYIITLALMTILMMFKSTVTIRYIMLIQIVGAIPIMDAFKNNKGQIKIFLTFIIISLIGLYSIYYYSIFKDQSFGRLKYNYYNNITNIFSRDN